MSFDILVEFSPTIIPLCNLKSYKITWQGGSLVAILSSILSIIYVHHFEVCAGLMRVVTEPFLKPCANDARNWP